MTGLISDYLRPIRRSSSEFLPNPLIRRRAFAAAMTNPPVVTPGGTTSGGLGGGTVIKTLPSEIRASNLPVFVPGGRSDYEPVLPYGANGDHSLSPRSRGFQNVRWEFDFTGQKFEFAVSNSGFKYRVWVNEQPAILIPVTATSTGQTQFFQVDLGAAASLAAPWRIMLELEGSSGLVNISHLNTDYILAPSLTAHGRLIVLGDSIPQGTWCSLTQATSNVSYSHGSFAHNLGWLLGLWDVWQGLSLGGRGFCQVNATNGNDTYLGNIVNDIIPFASHPTGKGMCVALQASTNDTTGAWTSQQRQDAMKLAISTLQAGLPDCLVFMFGVVGVPVSATWDTINADAKAASDTQGIDFLDTSGKITPGARAIFTGTGTEGTGVNGTGNADVYAPQDDNVTYPGKGSPHPNQKGHDHIARMLAPQFARRMGINLATDGVRVV